MDTQQAMVHGWISQDGSLEVGEKLNLPPGPVDVTVQPAVVRPPRDGTLDVLEETRAEREAEQFLMLRELPEALKQRFAALALKWKNETGHLSNITKKCTHPSYQQIIGMGREAVPLILQDLKDSKADWFWALTAITGANPIPEESVGNINQMTEAWLQWGRAEAYDV
jgi:hypothetical protein